MIIELLIWEKKESVEAGNLQSSLVGVGESVWEEVSFSSSLVCSV